uniref:Alpha-1,3-mannosyl-glycoprotein 2-beta-N-acetylglucosaminyltransferase n=1 Tax=Elaeophora elaphi TaxID=1147741 RepID=A0A0R3RQL4_9BILA
MPRIRSEYIFIILTFFYIGALLRLLFYPLDSSSADPNFLQLKYRIKNLEELLQEGKNEIALLQKKLDEIERRKNFSTIESVKPYHISLSQEFKPFVDQLPNDNGWPGQIPVLVFVCNRPKAIKNHLEKLLRYRPSAEKFPIIVSQDCDDSNVKKVIGKFGTEVIYIKHLSSKDAHITVLPEHKRYITYYQIARHYKLGLSYVFDKLNYSSVIITEDDLDVAPDFFEYFSATRALLGADKTLYCVSAWNDNGKAYLIDKKQPELLYRSDFFPGLGWMMTRELWNELGPIWPIGFWDDWIRNNTVRKNRACIRPEISRTGMTVEGKKGASRGLFFTQHLAKIIPNDVFINFTKLNLRHLLKENYDRAFMRRVFSAPLVSSTEQMTKAVIMGSGAIRIEYSTLENYLQIADHLKIMRDFKDGVPRTAYLGVVTCFVNSVRIYIAPDWKTWSGYNSSWEAPSE